MTRVTAGAKGTGERVCHRSRRQTLEYGLTVLKLPVISACACENIWHPSACWKKGMDYTGEQHHRRMPVKVKKNLTSESVPPNQRIVKAGKILSAKNFVIPKSYLFWIY